MKKKIFGALLVIIFAILLGFFVVKSEPRLNKNFDNEASFFKEHTFRLGLDLSGGSHLVYKADVSGLESSQVEDSMEALRDVIERRVNLFGIAEPIVQVQKASFISGGEERLIVDLPGITNVEEATEMIGQTPLLEFKIEAPEGARPKAKVDENGVVTVSVGDQFIPTELTGRYLKRAVLNFNQGTREPMVTLEFDEKGKELFAKITKENIGKMVAIYLDGSAISTPVVREEIPNGEAVISGGFTPTEAKLLVGRLNSGALPVPINLISKQTIGATLGEDAVNAGVKSALYGFALVGLFLILWYRLPGLVATVSLFIFILMMLSIFKLLPVTLTAAGIAGFIITIGVAVDANVLIFERIKEELRDGRSVPDAVSAGFSRAWFSIRDSNFSTILSSIILFWFGTSLIQGFALTLGIGILVSLFSAVVITKIFLSILSRMGDGRVAKFLFSSGFSK